uniref:Transmembrane protein 116 n=1 Tax=Seriola dumerili TaxID=41447 RepID=A0A3B4VEF5_SERDU
MCLWDLIRSVLGSGSIIACVMSQRLSRTPELQPLFLLSVSDLLLALCWLIGAALFSKHCNSLNAHCYNLHTVEQVLYMASFFYTLNYMWNLYTGIREKFYSCHDGYPVQVDTRPPHSVIPLLLMMPVFIQGNISQCQANFSEPYRCLLLHTGALYLTTEQHQPVTTCSLLHTYSIVVFLLAFILTLLSITVFVVKARRIYRRVVTSNGYLGNQQRTSFRVMDRRMLLYPLAFTSASQGFLNCLVYGWTRARLRRAGRTALSRDVDTQTPLLRSQKKRSYQALNAPENRTSSFPP